MGNNIFLTGGQLPSETEDPRLQVPLNPANFTLPGPNSLGIGNTPPTLFYGPWRVEPGLLAGQDDQDRGEARRWNSESRPSTR